ncbi:MAG: hypothetical protein LBD41_04385 [Clostridiales Family XIII bacterium]|nr:hypothetical protein [Clostridiales Family XIII bacterium]
MEDVLIAEFKNPDNKKHYAVIGVKSVSLENDNILINTEDPTKSLLLFENPIRIKALKLNLYKPKHGEVSDLLGLKGLFANSMKIIDGRKKEE